MPAPYSSLSIANEFIRRGLENNSKALTQMQVQKLVYLAHGWNLAAQNESLIEDNVEAWKFGPVIRPLYSSLSKYGDQPITREIYLGEDTVLIDSDDGEIALEQLNDNENAVIDLIWDVYGSYPAFKLSALTHKKDTPWSKTYVESFKKVIPNSLIQEHFKQLIAN